MAFLQGVTELFPISSLGHAVIFPRLSAGAIWCTIPDFLPYLVVMHLGTAAALFLYFWRDWVAFLSSLIKADTPRALGRPAHLRSRRAGDDSRRARRLRLAKNLGEAFASPSLAAFFLVLNGFALYFGDEISLEGGGVLDQLNWKGALAIGVAQCFALIPGFSRSGLTIAAGTSPA